MKTLESGSTSNEKPMAEITESTADSKDGVDPSESVTAEPKERSVNDKSENSVDAAINGTDEERPGSDESDETLFNGVVKTETETDDRVDEDVGVKSEDDGDAWKSVEGEKSERIVNGIKTDEETDVVEEKKSTEEVKVEEMDVSSVAEDKDADSVSRTKSVDSEERPASLTSNLDEDSCQSTMVTDIGSKEWDDRRGRKRRRLIMEREVDMLDSGRKRVRVEKRSCSDGEQDEDLTADRMSPVVTPAAAAKADGVRTRPRARSCSDADLIKDLRRFHIQCNLDYMLKGDKSECSAEEKKSRDQVNAREERLRSNVLRLLKRQYENMSQEDFEDVVYVAIMDYFSHYNSSTMLQRKVLMLEKLVYRLQENYNRVCKQFSEAKFLLRRMVAARKESGDRCVCKDRLPFKLIRSVAVQVQTSRCRGGDMCPGMGVGLDPSFKPNSGPLSAQIRSDLRSAPSSTANDSGVEKTKTLPVAQVVAGAVEARSSKVAPSSPQPARAREPENKSPPKGPSFVHRTLRVAAPALQSSPSKPPEINGRSPPPAPSNSSVVIDLTDKDEDVVITGQKNGATEGGNKSTVANVASTTPVTRVVKTSVISPMPQLPPLPGAPMYKTTVKRPPQPVLKVCKADQSGIMLSWTLRSSVPIVNEIQSYQVYACQENGGVTREWSTVGDVKALPLPMACTLSQFREGHRYHFVVRAVDKDKVLGEFSHPASILLVSKGAAASNLPTNSGPVRRVWKLRL